MDSCDSDVLGNGGTRSRHVLLGLSLVTGGLVCAAVPFLMPAFRTASAPFIPSTDSQASRILAYITSRPKCRRFIDLGSGDGRLVIAAAQHGIPSVGVELNPWLIAISKYRALFAGVSRQCSFRRQDLWQVDLSRFDGICVFGCEGVMLDLGAKIRKEAKVGTKVICNQFPLPGWTPANSSVAGVWFYEV